MAPPRTHRGPLRLTPGLQGALEERILDRTTKCLTTPFDRELVRCVTQGGPPRACMVEFQGRRRVVLGGPSGLP